MEELRNVQGIEIVAEVYGDWEREKAYHLTDSLLRTIGPVDFIVAQNDQMGIGARQAVNEITPDHPTIIVGVDALGGKGNGIEAICDGVLNASVTYVSHGDKVLTTAAAILHSEPYERYTVIPPTLVTLEAAQVLRSFSMELEHEVELVYRMQDQVLTLGNRLNLQKTLTFILLVLILLIVAIVIVVRYAWHERMRLAQERERADRLLNEQKERLKEMSTELARVQAKVSSADKFKQKLTAEIESRLAEPTLNVEVLASAMNMSRAQLFRRTKELTGQAPVDLIRIMRLERAKQLLIHTDDTIAEVAYTVGFSSPSYFSKCYLAHFGIQPKDEHRNHGK